MNLISADKEFFAKLLLMKITLDPTHAEFTTLKVGEKITKFPHAKRDGGNAIIRKLSKLEITKVDELQVVVGPGNFTAVRIACLIGNTVKFLTECKLYARKQDSKKFHTVTSLQPFYACEPSITKPKSNKC